MMKLQKRAITMTLKGLVGMSVLAIASIPTDVSASRNREVIRTYFSDADHTTFVGVSIYPCNGRPETVGQVTPHVQVESSACQVGPVRGAAEADAPCEFLEGDLLVRNASGEVIGRESSCLHVPTPRPGF